MKRFSFAPNFVCILAAGLALLTACPTGPATPTPTPEPTPSVSYTAYYYNEHSWASVSAYAWTGSGASAAKHLGDWPGKAMQSLGSGWYSIAVPGVTASNIIFNNSNQGSQTADLYRSGDGSYYKGRWFDGDLRASPPQFLVDFGNPEGAVSVLRSGAPVVSLEVIPATGILEGSSLQFLKKSDLSSVATAVSLASGSATIDLATVMASIDDGDALQLVAAAANGAGAGAETFEYLCETTPPAGYTDDPDGDAGTPADPWIPLGAYTSGGRTYFRIWSPDSSSVVVNVGGTDHEATLLPAFGIYADVYEYSTPSCIGSAYQFKIGGTAVRDPYGLMIIGGQNVVMNMSGGDTGAPPALANREDSIIYEVHVRDFTIDASWNGTEANRGKFLGMVQSGTSYSEGPTVVYTGLEHLVELGITHVQLLPVYDFGSGMYSWGYDPVNYNIPEEQYSAVPTNATGRVSEFRQMVKGFHDTGIRVVMDVVYNHTQGTDTFSPITPRYYTGTNLSGCGNALNTGEPMVSRMIRDSLDQWVANYGIDGFRFDLIGVFHTAAVEDWGTFLNAKYQGRNLLLYGEPWNGFSADAEENLKVRYPRVSDLDDAHVGVFNGEFRDNIRGSNPNNDGVVEDGYIQGAIGYKKGTNGIVWGLRGSPDGGSTDTWTPLFAADPEQTINYAAAHDNFCLWDQVLSSNGKTFSTATETERNMARFAFGVLLASQGIPFIHAGDEMLRSKTAEGTVLFTDWRTHNSYNAGDGINKIRWSWKIANAATLESIKDLIALRKATAAFRLTTNAEVTACLPPANVTTNGSGVINAFIDTAGTDVRLVLNPSTSVATTASGVDASWTRVWSSSEGPADVPGAVDQAVPVSTMAIYVK